jgi:hypothetical protein
MLVFGVLLVAWPPSVPAVRAQSTSLARRSAHTAASRGAVSKRDDNRAGACVVSGVNDQHAKNEQRVVAVQHVVYVPRYVAVQHVVYVPRYVTVTRVVYVPRYITHVVYVHDPAAPAAPENPPTETPLYAPQATPTSVPYYYAP